MKPSSLGTALLLTTCPAIAQVERGVFLLDRSGSMSPARVTASLAAVKDDLTKFFQNSSAQQPREALIVEFSGQGGTVLRYRRADGTVSTTPVWQLNFGDADAAAAASTVASGSTQLAQSICITVQDLVNRTNTLQGQLWCGSKLYVYSDGGENASSGPCSGPDDVNASTGRCPLDIINAGSYPNIFSGSWQRNTCDNIWTLVSPGSILASNCLLPGALVHGRLFNTITDVPTESQVFRLVRSLVGQTGGSVLQVPDGSPYVPGSASAINVTPIGCRTPAGELPVLTANGPARIGNSTALNLAGTSLPLPMMLVGFAELPQPLSLAPLGSTQCRLGVDYVTANIGTFLPMFVPQNPSLVGLKIFAQGVTLTAALNQLAISHMLELTVLP